MLPRLHVTDIDERPLTEIRYLNAGPRGGTVVERLPITRATVGDLPGDLDAIIACSDLQGIVPGRDGLATLLGVAVADALGEFALDGVFPPAMRTGVVLAGDLYAVPEANRRGGYGDVADVWAAFAERFAWVVGVAGNHDDISGVAGLAPNVRLLDGNVIELDEIRIGGVGKIIGNAARPGRRAEDAQLEHIQRAVDAGLDMLVLHEGPHGDGHQPGNSMIRAVLEACVVPLTVCGHSHWESPLAAHASGQILNVDARVVVLVGAGATFPPRYQG